MVAPRGPIPSAVPRFRFCAAAPSLWRGLLRVGALTRLRLPLQCLLAAPYDWAAAIAQARLEGGPFDVTVVVLSRIHPWIRKSLEGNTVLDAVDSLQRSAEERSKAAGPLARWFWRMEQRRMARIELDAAHSYGRVVVVSEDEIADFADAEAVTNGITTGANDDGPRAFDFGFWGRLRYFANADAVEWILEEIWPAIQALQPAATLVIGGAEATRSLRRRTLRRGVALVSPIDDVPSFARSIRVALMPLRYGSGQSNKVLEAAEAGCAIVGTPQALRGLAPLARFVRIESTAAGVAAAAVRLLADRDGSALLAQRLHDVVETRYARSATLDRLSAIAVAGLAVEK